MPRHKAILIQDVLEYSELIKPFLGHFLLCNRDSRITEETILKWIITEQLERIYYLFTDTHLRKEHPYEQLLHHVKDNLAQHQNLSLDILTAFYIKAPRLYSDNSLIEIKLSGRNLTITYTSDITLT